MKKTILLVDDEPEILKIYSAKLKSAGFEVFSAENGADAVSVAKREKPDLILMDVKMPVMDGVEAAMKIKEDPETKDVKFIFLTAFSDPEYVGADLKLAKEIGAVDFIKKGLSLDDLVAKVQQHVK